MFFSSKSWLIFIKDFSGTPKLFSKFKKSSRIFAVANETAKEAAFIGRLYLGKRLMSLLTQGSYNIWL